MGWFSSKSEEGVPTTEEVHAAARALQNGKSRPADRLVEMSGSNAQSTALNILAAAVDYEPSNQSRR
jgi:hypothetical protein